MTGNDEQAVGPDSQDNYESIVLDFLDRELAAIRLRQQATEQPDELNALVSDFLKRVTTASDQIKTGRKADSEEMGEEMCGPPLECKAAGEEAISSESKDVMPDLESEPARFESRDAMLAEYMAIQEKASASENSAASHDSELDFSQLSVSDDLLAEFMPPKEAVLSMQNQDMPPDSGLEASQFKALDAMLAEFMALQEEALSAETGVAPIHPDPAPGKSEELRVRLADPVVPPAIVSPPENKVTPLKPVAIPMPQKVAKEPSNGDIRKPETRNSVVLRYPTEKAALSDAPARKTGLKQARPVSAAKAVNSKTLLIAAACICLLAIFAVPGRYFPGTSKNESKRAGRQPASSASLPSHATPPVLISQVSPKYPALAAKTRASASVVLDLSIDSDGNVVKAAPMSGPELFYKEAIRAAMKWRYKPASIAGSNVPGKSRVTFNFSLKN